jgi:hypothetical protein
MGAFTDIQAALEVKLALLNPALPTAYENVPYTPTPGTAWCRVNLLPAPTEPASIGTNGYTRHEGIFQVSLYYPVGYGPGPALAKADAVASLFARGTELSAGTTSLKVVTSSRGPALQDADWFHVPITIQWQAFV